MTLWVRHRAFCKITGHLLGSQATQLSILVIIRLDRKDDVGSTRIPFLSFLSSLLFLDLVKKLHKAVPGPVPALREVSARWPSPDVEGFPNPRSLPRHLPAVTLPQPRASPQTPIQHLPRQALSHSDGSDVSSRPG